MGFFSMSNLNNLRNYKFDLLRSHWSNGDKVWLANVHVKNIKGKVLSHFCYFGKGIAQDEILLYPNKERDFSVKIIIPDALIFMDTSRIVQYLIMDLAK